MSPFTSQENHLRFELPPLENDVASAETLTHRKANYVPFVQELNFSAIENEDEFEDEDDS